MQPPQLVPVPVTSIKFQPLVKVFYQLMRPVKVNDDRNKHQQLQYRVQLPKDGRFISSCTCFYTITNLQYQNALLQQQGAEMQHNGSQLQRGKSVVSRISMPTIQAIRKTMVNRAKPRNRFAAWLTFGVNHNSRIKVSPINIAPRKARSKRVIWKVYVFK